MEEKREGGLAEEEEGASKQHIYICISTLDLVIRQRKNQLPPKHSRGIASITYFPAAQTLENDSPHLFFLFLFFFFLSEAYLNLPGQLVDCGEFCARLALSISI